LKRACKKLLCPRSWVHKENAKLMKASKNGHHNSHNGKDHLDVTRDIALTSENNRI
jgi:hypothetical protein